MEGAAECGRNLVTLGDVTSHPYRDPRGSALCKSWCFIAYIYPLIDLLAVCDAPLTLVTLFPGIEDCVDSGVGVVVIGRPERIGRQSALRVCECWREVNLCY